MTLTSDMDLRAWLERMWAASDRRGVRDAECRYCDDGGWIFHAKHADGSIVMLRGRERSCADQRLNRLGPVRCDHPRCRVFQEYKAKGGFNPVKDYAGRMVRQPRFQTLARRFGYTMISHAEGMRAEHSQWQRDRLSRHTGEVEKIGEDGK